MPADIRHSVLSLMWAPEVILALSAGPQRFNWLLHDIAGISDRVLKLRLDDLASAGLVSRQVRIESPIRVSYALTEKGELYVPALQALRAITEEAVVA